MSADTPSADINGFLEACEERLRTAGWDDAAIRAAHGSPISTPERIARLLVAHALDVGATDLHLAPSTRGLIVTERLKAEIHTLDPPLAGGAGEAVVRVCKALAGLGDESPGRSERGHAFVVIGGLRANLRATTYPSVLGEALSLRIVPLDRSVPPLADLLPSDLVSQLRSALAARPEGVFLAAGATGSGKSIVLHSVFRDLQSPTRRLMTIEEGLVYQLDGVVQAVVTPDFTVAAGLRSMLASDVDVALVPELDNAEIATLAFHAARDGHYILSQVHAPDAVSALHRLAHQAGVDPALIGEQLLAVTGQRLVGRSCAACRVLRVPTEDEADRLGLSDAQRSEPLASNEGCADCGSTGTKGRLAVAELVTMTPELAVSLRGGDDVDGLRSALGPEFRSIDDDLRSRLISGSVSIESAIRAMPARPELTPSLRAVVDAVSEEDLREVWMSQGTVTVMFTDIVDSTVMTAEMGDSAWMAVQRHHDELIRKQLGEWGGREIKSMGDGFMIAFPSATSALRCGLAIQDSSGSIMGPGGRRVHVRVGLHAGEPVREGSDLFGTAVIVAARVNAAAGPGEVLVTDLVRGLVSGSADFEFDEPRSVELKGLEGSHLLYPVTRA